MLGRVGAVMERLKDPPQLGLPTVLVRDRLVLDRLKLPDRELSSAGRRTVDGRLEVPTGRPTVETRDRAP
mgnify:CR=1 FL=1|jgi:hypothetical protein